MTPFGLIDRPRRREKPTEAVNFFGDKSAERRIRLLHPRQLRLAQDGQPRQRGATVDLRRVDVAEMASPAWRLESFGEQARKVAHQVQLALTRITRFAGVEVLAHPTRSLLRIDRLAPKLDVLGRRVELLRDRINRCLPRRQRRLGRFAVAWRASGHATSGTDHDPDRSMNRSAKSHPGACRELSSSPA